MTRVVLFSKAFSPSVGGIETSSAMLASIWRDAGHEVLVVTGTPGPPVADGIPVVRDWSVRNLRRAIRTAERVATNGYSRAVATLAVTCGKRPVILHQGYQLICSDGLGFRGHVFHNFNRRRDLRLAFAAGFHVGLKAMGTHLFDSAVRALEPLARHVVPSGHLGRRLGLRDYLVLYQPPNPDVVAEIKQRPAPPASARREAYETGNILFFGRLVFEKGVDNLIRAFALARSRGVFGSRRPPLLVLHGDGPERMALQDLAEHLGIADSVHFAGFLNGAGIVEKARAASLVVFPSRWEEPGATMAVELFMMGAAVLASRHGATGEIFEGHGRLFENQSIEELVDGLAAHFRDGPRYPNPTGKEPWALANIQRVARSLLEHHSATSE